MRAEHQRADEAELSEVLAQVRRIAAWSRRRVRSSVAGGYATAFKGAGQEFEQVREYAEGDDPRSVEWNVTARMGRPFVKTFAAERDRGVMLLVDTGPTTRAGLGALCVRRAIATLVAAVALTADDHGDRVGAVFFASDEAEVVPPVRGSAHALRLVRDALFTEPARRSSTAHPSKGGAPKGSERPGSHGLLAALERVRRASRQRALVFVLSDFVAPLDPAPLRAFARRHDAIALRVSGAEHTPGVLRGLVRLGDPFGGPTRVVDADAPAFQRAWRARTEARRRRFEALCTRAGWQGVDAPVPFDGDADALVRPLAEALVRRGPLAAGAARPGERS